MDYSMYRVGIQERTARLVMEIPLNLNPDGWFSCVVAPVHREAGIYSVALYKSLACSFSPIVWDFDWVCSTSFPVGKTRTVG